MEPVRRFRKASIKEVARHAGVSTTTVSVFVSGRESVCSPDTAERIRAAISALHYTPSSVVSGLRQRPTRVIGVCIRSPLDPHIFYGNRFFERLWRGVTAQADTEDYSLLHFPASARDGEVERVEPFLDGRVDGMLFHDQSDARVARVASAGMPTVLLTRSRNLPAGCGAVHADESRTVNAALSHLWALGHRRIAHASGPVHPTVDEIPGEHPEIRWPDDIATQRRDEYRCWMRARDLYSPTLLACAGTWQGERAAEVVAAWRQMPDPPTAVFCANDAIAAQIIAAATACGWRVPKDLSVVGVDNATGAHDADPPLTSVEVGLEEIGREAMRCLLRLMDGAPLEECRVALPVSELVVRASTAEPRPA